MEEEETFKCFCSNKIFYLGQYESNLISHISECEQFKKESPFASEFTLISLKFTPQKLLYTLRAEFLSYVVQIENQIMNNNGKLKNNVLKIFDKNSYINQLEKQINLQQSEQNKNKNNQNNNHNHQNSNSQSNQNKADFKKKVINISLEKSDQNTKQILNKNPPQVDKKPIISSQESFQNLNLTECTSCKSQFDGNFEFEQLWFLQNCLHVFCKQCLVKQVNEEYVKNKGQLQCKQCKSDFNKEDYSNIVSKEILNNLENQMFESQFNIVSCVGCKQKYDFAVGAPNSNVLDNQGKQLNQIHLRHYDQNRFICKFNNCKQEQCKSCGSTPYHLGYLCEQYKEFKNSKRCRYCNTTIEKQKAQKEEAFQDICDNKECKDKQKLACNKIKACGHPCCGIKDEMFCPPCLFENCDKQNLKGVTGNDYCGICFVEGLINAPIIQTDCKHFFHYECIKKKLQMKWLTPRIMFNYSQCPQCKQLLEFAPDIDLTDLIEDSQKLQKIIKNKSLLRLKAEERDKDKKVVDKDSRFHNKPLEYAMEIYSYYMCFKCNKPYFGGLKDCERALNEDQKTFNQKDLICPDCCDIPIENCKKHGKEFIEFKCRFCCSVAVWFCFGTTHFCDPCHSGAGSNKESICLKQNGCPFKGNHNPNGQETALGCSICRAYKESNKDY